jgi:hypothetical protein
MIDDEIISDGYLELFNPISLRVICCTYAYFNKDYTGNDLKRSFINLCGRLPTERELEFINKVEKKEAYMSREVYFNNYMVHCTRNIIERSGPYIVPSSKEITNEYIGLTGHDFVDKRHLYTIARYIRLNTIMVAIDTWQLMIIAAAFDSLKIIKNNDKIRILFNKIYKRNPTKIEIESILSLNLNKPKEEIRNEIVKHFAIKDFPNFEGRRFYKPRWLKIVERFRERQNK